MEGRASIKRILRLFFIAAKMDFAWLMRDTKYALAGITADLMSNIASVGGVFLIALRFGGIGGLSSDEVLFMLAYSTLITGVFILFSSNNSIHISRVIGRGQLEHLFQQPLSLKVQLFTSGFAPFTAGGNFVAGVTLMVIAANRLSLDITWHWLLLLVFNVAITMTIIIARSYLMSTAAFYAPVAAEEIATTAIDGTWFLSTFPLSGMPRFIQIPLVTLLPEGLLAWFPSLVLLGKPPMGLPSYYPALFALILVIITTFVFRKGLAYYVTVGSNRYTHRGFR